MSCLFGIESKMGDYIKKGEFLNSEKSVILGVAN